MDVRKLIVRNLGWKVLSLVLGILFYVFMRAHMEGDVFLLQRLTEEHFEQTVSVLATAELDGVFRIEPRIVRVTVIGRRDVVSRLTESDIRAYVDMTDVTAEIAVRRTVHIQPLPEVVRVEVVPGAVRVAYEPAVPPEERKNQREASRQITP
jgi:YbbR domain-containing protein